MMNTMDTTPPPEPFLPQGDTYYAFSHLRNPWLLRLDAALLLAGAPLLATYTLRAIAERGDAPAWVPVIIILFSATLAAGGVWALWAAGRVAAWRADYTRIMGHAPGPHIHGTRNTSR